MKKTLIIIGLVCFGASVIACAPVTVQKCYEDYTYDANGIMIKKYSECISQTPEKMPPLKLKNKDLYE